MSDSQVPSSIQAWLDEIKQAHHEACTSFALYKITGQEGVANDEFWKMTPHLVIKKRGVEESEVTVNQAELTIEATIEDNRATQEFDILDFPIPAFALCYLAANFAFDFVEEEVINDIMQIILKDIEEDESSWFPASDS